MKTTKELNKMRVGTHDCAQKEQGITLIALVITIIVMLILVAVTISMAINGGLFQKASEAGTATNGAVANEQLLASGKIKVGNEWYASIEDYIEAKVELPEGIKVGDYVNYTPTKGTYKVAGGEYGSGYETSEECQTFETEVDNPETTDVNEALQWRILSIDEETGEIELVAATAAQTATALELRGADGYNHAVDILNDLCETLYSKTVNGEKVATARSINVEDINKKTTYNPREDTRWPNYDTEFRYSTKNYSTSYRRYPNLYEKEDGFYVGGEKQTNGILGSVGLDDGVTGEDGITRYSTVTGYTDDWDNTTGAAKKDVSVTWTGYAYYPEDNSCLRTDLGFNNAPKGLLNVGADYWVATRQVTADSSFAFFDVLYMQRRGALTGNTLTYSHDAVVGIGCGVRPVITLGSKVSLKVDEANEDSSKTVWDIEF